MQTVVSEGEQRQGRGVVLRTVVVKVTEIAEKKRWVENVLEGHEEDVLKTLSGESGKSNSVAGMVTVS